MQNRLKASLLWLITLLPFTALAVEDEQTTEPESSPMLRQAGHVPGFLSLPQGNAELAATLIKDRLGKAYGKVLILHDSDGAIASPGLINTLRLSLPEAGWTTMTVALAYPRKPDILLSVSEQAEDSESNDAESMITSESDITAENSEKQSEEIDNPSRIATAMAYLNAQHEGPTVVIAIGKAASLALGVRSQQGDIKAQIWIAPDLSLAEAPELTSVLDIDLKPINERNDVAIDRKIMMQQSQDLVYSQRLVTSAGHDFRGFESTVLGYVRGWLMKHFDSEAQS